MANTLRVLVVDDMRTTREFLAESLRELGIRDLTTTSNALEALEVLENGETDLVISDLHMPDMDGIELYRRMKKCNRLGKAQFVLATADNALADLPAEYRVGGHRMLRKPYTSENLLDCLEEAEMRRCADAESVVRRPG